MTYNNNLFSTTASTLTFITIVTCAVELSGVISMQISHCIYTATGWYPYAFIPQVAHENLQANQCKYTQTKDSQNHHIWKFLYWLEQSSYNGLQTCEQQITQHVIMQRIIQWAEFIHFKNNCMWSGKVFFYFHKKYIKLST